MSLLLDALKKAAQEKLDKEKASGVVDDVESESSENDNNISLQDNMLEESDATALNSTVIDVQDAENSSADQTEMESTSVTGLVSDETEIEKRSEVIDATQIESSDETKLGTELELELESDLTGLTIAPDVLDSHSAADLQRVVSAEAERELVALDQDTTGDIHTRGERVADYDLGLNKQDATEHDHSYSGSLTRNLQAEQQDYVAGSPDKAAQVFSSKQPESADRTRLYVLSGIAVLFLVLLGLMFGWEYLAELKQSQIIKPIARNNLDEPLSATLNRNNSEQVDPELLIEQEDYSEILQEQLAEYEDEPVTTGEIAATKQTTKAAPVKRTVASRNGEYRIIRSRKTNEPLRQILLRAYGAYQRGELDQARIIYRQALTKAPRNRDALLGMAAISIAGNDIAEARKYYRELLTQDPKDDMALAGLAGLEQQPGQVEAEISRIKLLLGEKPNSAHLNFALGNLFAKQDRWAEAQKAYFNALRLNDSNADFVFNMAVSLEHLGQNKEALKFYRRALLLAQSKHPHFNIALAQSRINALSGQ